MKIATLYYAIKKNLKYADPFIAVKIALREHSRVIQKFDYKMPLFMEVTSTYGLMRLKEKEPETVQWVENIRPGEIFYDIGANVGSYAMIAASRGVTVYAFEPSSFTYALLCRNIFLNKLEEWITPFPIALAEHTELGYLAYSSLREGAAHHVMERAFRPRSQAMLSYALDDLVKYLPAPDHIKLDTDGYELHALRGAQSLLPKLKSLIIEIDERSPEAKEVYTLLKDFVLLSKHPRGKKEVYNCIFVQKK